MYVDTITLIIFIRSIGILTYRGKIINYRKIVRYR